ncbi:MAG TPA: hypothetical protein ENL03_03665, partial [Phycisphaerae bacterium]|nr:hypothetical protein [Phycisphaerae bacterium]
MRAEIFSSRTRHRYSICSGGCSRFGNNKTIIGLSKTSFLSYHNLIIEKPLTSLVRSLQRNSTHKQREYMKKPNIIFIMADDMGYGDVGCYNPSSRIPTPNMDRLANQGIRFTDAHSPSAVCTPSRYGVLTGRYCWRSRLKQGVLYGYEPPLIEKDRLTVAGMLQQKGYNTACIGKWHLGLGYTAKPGKQIDFDAPLPWSDATRKEEESIDFTRSLFGGPTEFGFDYFFGTSGCSTAQPPYGFIENDRFIDPPDFYREKSLFTARAGMTAPGWDDKEVDPIICRKAVDYIERQAKSDKPFFLYMTPTSPHE